MSINEKAAVEMKEEQIIEEKGDYNDSLSNDVENELKLYKKLQNTCSISIYKDLKQ